MEREGGKRRDLRLRRARREDIPALCDHVGGPPAGRVRALRRLLKTLSADVHVIDREGHIDGFVSVTYRRSFTHGGLLATVDAMMSFRESAERRREDLALLATNACHRAEQRGCVAIDGAVVGAEEREALRERGFAAGPEKLERSLRREGGKG